MNEYNQAYQSNNFFDEKEDNLLINHSNKIKTGGKVPDIISKTNSTFGRKSHHLVKEKWAYISNRFYQTGKNIYA
ncbi:MAG: hypothetical protein ABFS35_02330 [Bacteroidota bacterium]